MPPEQDNAAGSSAEDLAILGNDADTGDKADAPAGAGDKGGDKPAADGAAPSGDAAAPAAKDAGDKGEKKAVGAKAASAKPAGGDGDAPKAGEDEVLWPQDGFPEDWRDRMLKSMGLEGDALKKAQEFAKRTASPAELLRRVMASDAKISEKDAEIKGRVKIPGEKASEEEVKAFQKAWGIPEAHDKYDLTAAGEMSEIDREIWDEVLPKFHKGHFSQGQLDLAAEAVKIAGDIGTRRMEEYAKAVDNETNEKLLLEYGSSKAVKANVELANRWLGETLGKHMDADARREFLNLKLEDGTRIGSHLSFVKAAIEAGRQWAPEGLPEIGEGGKEVDIDARIREIMKISHSSKPADKKEYQRLQPELERLIAVQNRRNAASAARK